MKVEIGEGFFDDDFAVAVDGRHVGEFGPAGVFAPGVYDAVMPNGRRLAPFKSLCAALMALLEAAGLPAGLIDLVPAATFASVLAPRKAARKIDHHIATRMKLFVSK